MGKNLKEIFPFLKAKVFKEYRQVFKTGKPLKTQEQTEIDGRLLFTETDKLPIVKDKKVIQYQNALNSLCKDHFRYFR